MKKPTAPTLIIMVGLPGSGKDYAIEHDPFFKHFNATVVSRDEIRFSMMRGNDSYFKNETRVYAKFIDAICNELRAGHNVIANATHITAESRRKLITNINRILSKDYNIVVYWVRATLEQCLERNARRVGLSCVPEQVIKGMFERGKAPNYTEATNIQEIYILAYNGVFIRRERT